MYAEKCKKEATALLDLMRQGGWLTAQEALDWGFVDEVTDFAEDAAPVLTDEQMTALAAANIPIPDIPKPTEATAFSKFLQTLSQFFNHTETPTPKPMNKFFKHICAILDRKEVEVSDTHTIVFAEADIDTLEAAFEAREKELHDLTNKVTEQETKVNDLTAQLADAKRQPAADTIAVVETHKGEQQKSQSPVDGFFSAKSNARKLFNALP